MLRDSMRRPSRSPGTPPTAASPRGAAPTAATAAPLLRLRHEYDGVLRQQLLDAEARAAASERERERMRDQRSQLEVLVQLLRQECAQADAELAQRARTENELRFQLTCERALTERALERAVLAEVRARTGLEPAGGHRDSALDEQRASTSDAVVTLTPAPGTPGRRSRASSVGSDSRSTQPGSDDGDALAAGGIRTVFSPAMSIQARLSKVWQAEDGRHLVDSGGEHARRQIARPPPGAPPTPSPRR